MIWQKPLIFCVTLSLALHVAILAWCPVPFSFSPPYPVYLVVDLFSGPATTGTGHGLNVEPGGASKPVPPATVPPKEPPQSTPAAARPAVARKPQVLPKPAKLKPIQAKKAGKQAPAPAEPQVNNTGLEQPPVADTIVNPVNGPALLATAKPPTSPQENSEEVSATVANGGIGTVPGTGFGSGSGTGTGSGSGSGKGQGLSGSGSPVETPFAYGSNPPPPYPSTARRRGWEGEVLLLVEVSAAGEVCKITVSRSSGYQILDSTALNAVYRWKFQAALRNGRAVSGKVLVPIRFDLKELE